MLAFGYNFEGSSVTTLHQVTLGFPNDGDLITEDLLKEKGLGRIVWQMVFSVLLGMNKQAVRRSCFAESPLTALMKARLNRSQYSGRPG